MQDILYIPELLQYFHPFCDHILNIPLRKLINDIICHNRVFQTFQPSGILECSTHFIVDFSGNGERAIFTDSWNYVLNSASKNKDAAIKFLQYMADEGGMEASYKAFDRYPARKDVAEKVVPDTDPAKEMYSQYAEECNVQGRPLVAQTMEFISDMGTIFQSCMKDEITVDEFCKKAQEVVDTYQ